MDVLAEQGVGQLAIDGNTLSINGRSRRLQPCQIKVLEVFIEHNGQSLTHEMLMKYLVAKLKRHVPLDSMRSRIASVRAGLRALGIESWLVHEGNGLNKWQPQPSED